MISDLLKLYSHYSWLICRPSAAQKCCLDSRDTLAMQQIHHWTIAGDGLVHRAAMQGMLHANEQSVAPCSCLRHPIPPCMHRLQHCRLRRCRCCFPAHSYQKPPPWAGSRARTLPSLRPNTDTCTLQSVLALERAQAGSLPPVNTTFRQRGSIEGQHVSAHLSSRTQAESLPHSCCAPGRSCGPRSAPRSSDGGSRWRCQSPASLIWVHLPCPWLLPGAPQD